MTSQDVPDARDERRRREKGPLLAQRSPTLAGEDVPLDEARRMSRGPRMDPEIDSALKQNIPSLDTTATCMTIPENITPTTMKNRLLHVAGALGMPVTIRKVLGDLLFWRSTGKDRQHTAEIVQHLQTARSKGWSRPGRRRRA